MDNIPNLRLEVLIDYVLTTRNVCSSPRPARSGTWSTPPWWTCMLTCDCEYVDRTRDNYLTSCFKWRRVSFLDFWFWKYLQYLLSQDLKQTFALFARQIFSGIFVFPTNQFQIFVHFPNFWLHYATCVVYARWLPCSIILPIVFVHWD